MMSLRVFIAAALLAQLVPAEPVPLADSFGRLSAAVSKVRELPTERPEQKTVLAEYAAVMAKDIGTMRVVIRDGVGTKLFREGLDLDSAALEDLWKRPLPSSRTLMVCGGVAVDLRAKVRFVEGSKGPLRDVTVVAKTMRGKAEEGGFEVWYAPAGWPDTPSRYGRFPGISSPVNKLLGAGGYLMWTATQTGGRKGERKPVDVGTGNEPVELPIPAETEKRE
jgi:hypothetical protein